VFLHNPIYRESLHAQVFMFHTWFHAQYEVSCSIRGFILFFRRCSRSSVGSRGSPNISADLAYEIARNATSGHKTKLHTNLQTQTGVSNTSPIDFYRPFSTYSPSFQFKLPAGSHVVRPAGQGRGKLRNLLWITKWSVQF
jgi:hypothetical protein